MASLAHEYFRRHGLHLLVPCDEGLCFFTHGTAKSNGIVCLTSSASKNFTTCRECENRRGLTVECFVQTGVGNPIFKLASHDHVTDPDADLRSMVKAKFGRAYEPVPLPSDVDAEKWLWEVFRSKYVSVPFVRGGSKDAYSQMIFCAKNHPKLFDLFVKTVYSPFMPNRKYMLIENVKR